VALNTDEKSIPEYQMTGNGQKLDADRTFLLNAGEMQHLESFWNSRSLKFFMATFS
jgi:hypothetical protein